MVSAQQTIIYKIQLIETLNSPRKNNEAIFRFIK